MTFNPEEDGVTHINIYSKGKTELGRWMSNWAYSPFYHPIHGSFDSIEGFWYWLGTQNDLLRTVHGYRAKEIGQAVDRTLVWEKKNFEKEVLYALKLKVEANPKMEDALRDSHLYLTHYYDYNGRIIELPQFEWITQWWRDRRARLKGDPVY